MIHQSLINEIEELKEEFLRKERELQQNIDNQAFELSQYKIKFDKLIHELESKDKHIYMLQKKTGKFLVLSHKLLK